MLEVLTNMLCKVDSLLLNIQDVAACSLEEVNLSVNFCVCWTKEQSQRCRMFPMDYFFWHVLILCLLYSIRSINRCRRQQAQ